MRTGRPRTGSLYLTKSGYSCRIRVDTPNGISQKNIKLGTFDKSVAEKLMSEMVQQKQEAVAVSDEEIERSLIHFLNIDEIVAATDVAKHIERTLGRTVLVPVICRVMARLAEKVDGEVFLQRGGQ